MARVFLTIILTLGLLSAPALAQYDTQLDTSGIDTGHDTSDLDPQIDESDMDPSLANDDIDRSDETAEGVDTSDETTEGMDLPPEDTYEATPSEAKQIVIPENMTQQ